MTTRMTSSFDKYYVDRSSSSPGSLQFVRYRCRVAYDGTGFCGFQLQGADQKKREQRTVQGQLEQVFSQRLNQPIRVVGAGRTDAGVHARGQAIHLDLLAQNNANESEEDWARQVEKSINKMLPDDVRIWNFQRAPAPREELVNGELVVKSWNVMRKSEGKWYAYRFCTGDCMDPIRRHDRWQLDWGHEVDLKYLNEILNEYTGTHDFVCFTGAIEANQRKTGKEIGTVRTIYSVTLVEEDTSRQLYRIDIHLQGALYKMVRNMVGTALDVSRGKLSKELFLEMLHNNANDNVDSSCKLTRKNNPCKPAQPQGLTLERVYYPDDDSEF